jgi:hypothetical protein
VLRRVPGQGSAVVAPQRSLHLRQSRERDRGLVCGVQLLDELDRRQTNGRLGAHVRALALGAVRREPQEDRGRPERHQADRSESESEA